MQLPRVVQLVVRSRLETQFGLGFSCCLVVFGPWQSYPITSQIVLCSSANNACACAWNEVLHMMGIYGFPCLLVSFPCLLLLAIFLPTTRRLPNNQRGCCLCALFRPARLLLLLSASCVSFHFRLSLKSQIKHSKSSRNGSCSLPAFLHVHTHKERERVAHILAQRRRRQAQAEGQAILILI